MHVPSFHGELIMARTKQGLALEALAEKVNRHKAAEMQQIGVRMPGDVLSVIDAIAKQLKVTRSDVVRMVVKAAILEGVAETGAPLVQALKKAGAAAHLMERQL